MAYPHVTLPMRLARQSVQDLNNALAAIVSNNSGSAEPATTYAYQFWADTTNNVLKIRNSGNNALGNAA